LTSLKKSPFELPPTQSLFYLEISQALCNYPPTPPTNSEGYFMRIIFCTRPAMLGALLAVATLNTHLSTVFAQGSLTPPGAPAPTMKSLAQIEPRTPVDSAHTPGDSIDQFVINQAGSYYLTTNLVGVSSKNGIGIFTNNVTLDLSGFSLLGTASSSDGIHINVACTNITVRNGTISGWGPGFAGIEGQGQYCIFERLNISANSFGISCGNGGTIRGCSVNGNQFDGIDVFGSGCLIEDNDVAGNNIAKSSPNTCLGISGSNNRVEGNHVTGNGAGFGIQISAATSTNNIVVKNSVIGNGANNYSTVPGNIIGPFINVTGTITNSNPWANFSY
jgi:parallel beta-helix repeat protein